MDNVFFWMIPIVAIAGGIAMAIVATMAKMRIRELEIRERIAMIERGLVPPPEVDPRGFDRAMHRMARLDRVRSASASRYRSAGVTMMGIGFGLMMLIAFAGGEAGIALGVGGFIVVLGAAFFVNSWFESRQPAAASNGYSPAPDAPKPTSETQSRS
jgi:hypothetical protein